jgi:hypothetical protein
VNSQLPALTEASQAHPALFVLRGTSYRGALLRVGGERQALSELEGRGSFQVRRIWQKRRRQPAPDVLPRVVLQGTCARGRRGAPQPRGLLRLPGTLLFLTPPLVVAQKAPSAAALPLIKLGQEMEPGQDRERA